MYVCMHVCMYACMHVCMYVFMHACIFTCTWMYVCIHVYMYACARVCVCMHACVCTCVCVCVCVRARVYTLGTNPQAKVECIGAIRQVALERQYKVHALVAVDDEVRLDPQRAIEEELQVEAIVVPHAVQPTQVRRETRVRLAVDGVRQDHRAMHGPVHTRMVALSLARTLRGCCPLVERRLRWRSVALVCVRTAWRAAAPDVLRRSQRNACELCQLLLPLQGKTRVSVVRARGKGTATSSSPRARESGRGVGSPHTHRAQLLHRVVPLPATTDARQPNRGCPGRHRTRSAAHA
jgi:hypothetical protein